MRLLIVEDDIGLATALRQALDRRDIASDHAATVGDACLMLDAIRYAAVLLDLSLPDDSGLLILALLRARNDPIPVLIVTAQSEVEQRIAGLDAGADDYLIKPFDFDELHARLNAVLRRNGTLQGSEATFGDLRYHSASCEISVGDTVVSLSSREAELIDLLLRRGGRVVTRELAESQLFGLSQNLGSNAIEVYVHRLRHKLHQSGAQVRIDTIKGVGYLMRAIS